MQILKLSILKHWDSNSGQRHLSKIVIILSNVWDASKLHKSFQSVFIYFQECQSDLTNGGRTNFECLFWIEILGREIKYDLWVFLDLLRDDCQSPSPLSSFLSISNLQFRLFLIVRFVYFVLCWLFLFFSW